MKKPKRKQAKEFKLAIKNTLREHKLFEKNGRDQKR